MVTKSRPRKAAATVPANSEWFELEVDDDQDPITVVTSAECSPCGWEYLGPKFAGKCTYIVKLVRLGCVRNLKEAREKADKLGLRLLEGQARESFKAKYPVPDGKSAIVFGGSEWRGPDGGALITCLYKIGDWYSYFHWSGSIGEESCRWAVVKK